MSAHPTEKPVTQLSETGWAKARRTRKKGVRTCLPAVDDRGGPQQDRGGPDWNIVRGED